MGIKKSELHSVADQLMGDEFKEIWFQDPNAEEHYHHDQTEGDKHVDAYHATRNDDGSIAIDKYHSDDK